ncbi:ROK family protein [Paenibacillus dendritiformis]|uniref:ROK family protein n=1 Tax=Paenibacillus dendritiformis TaxID=130049 RepID=UPI001F0D6967|nr:ROK family protein [Paenibacillus dendritiformis]
MGAPERPEGRRSPGRGAAAPSKAVTLALDAGGTALKGAVVAGGRLVPGLAGQWPSRADGEPDAIVAGFAAACGELLAAYAAYTAAGPEAPAAGAPLRIGFAFPGPFDYAAGVARLQGLGKYERLYGVNVREALWAEFAHQAMRGIPHAAELARADIRFANDALLFALGLGRRYPGERLLCLTLGTGLGSAFIEAGQPVAGRDGVPPGGLLYAEPYRGQPADGQFGRRGILRLAGELGAGTAGGDVHDLAAAAYCGDPGAAAVFAAYGRRLSEFLAPYVAAFRPRRLILGGQIAKSASLFLEPLEALLRSVGGFAETSDRVMEHTYEGIDALFGGTRSKT